MSVSFLFFFFYVFLSFCFSQVSVPHSFGQVCLPRVPFPYFPCGLRSELLELKTHP